VVISSLQITVVALIEAKSFLLFLNHKKIEAKSRNCNNYNFQTIRSKF